MSELLSINLSADVDAFFLRVFHRHLHVHLFAGMDTSITDGTVYEEPCLQK